MHNICNNCPEAEDPYADFNEIQNPKNTKTVSKTGSKNSHIGQNHNDKQLGKNAQRENQ